MPRLIVTEKAALGLERCRRFLAGKSPIAARQAAHAINQQFRLLETTPDIGRLVAEEPDYRELLIGFGASGYVCLYHHSADDDAVYILAFRHQREAGY